MHVDAILISILQYCFICREFQLGDSFGIATQLGVSQRVKAPNPDATQGGGGGLGSPLAGFPPNTKN
jgi:hypothetical protein